MHTSHSPPPTKLLFTPSPTESSAIVAATNAVAPAPSTLRVTFVGHATLLVELGSTRIMTDPIFDARLSRLPFIGARTARVGPPAFQPETLPRPDAVILTHAHADHLSFDSLRSLPHTTPVFVPLALVEWLRRRGVTNVIGLAAGQSITMTRAGSDTVTITAGAAKHNGARYGVDHWHAATNFYLLDDGTTSCFFAGDTALTDRANVIVDERLRSRGRGLDVAILPINFAPWWHPGLRSGHLTWHDALVLFEQLGARYLIPCHWGAYRFPDSGPFDAIRQLRRALVTYPHADRVCIIDPGGSFESVARTPARA